ncbi:MULTISPECIES: M43 family zinc metalloprotease [unclassified Flavobacterium]|uniref:M43 family zinc metalloprotease n=1 Tax=unclassified Flavobacterium TaxID=196869 RepID=UPI001F12A13E|nr:MULTISPECIES: M43 family zinc metalloprotease [unclassified Flavobacterium]UMY66876.1 hypothetical protein MKO97_05700 [Flavobacterium sp. HJ-32-4]
MKRLFLFAALAGMVSCRTVYETVQLPGADTVLDSDQIITIPVIVHVLCEDPTTVNAVNINAMVATLSSDFAGTNTSFPRAAGTNPAWVPDNSNIRFTLATVLPDGTPTNGIIVKQTRTRVFRYQQRKPFAESKLIEPYRYLNVYVCRTNTGAFTPSEAGNHGVVIDPDLANGTSHTLTHEAGHWLGLRHIFEGGRNGDDGIADTPTQKKNLGKALSYPYQQWGHDIMVTNFMGYNASRDFFSADQIRAMRQFALRYMPLTLTARPALETIDISEPIALNAMMSALDVSYVFPCSTVSGMNNRILDKARVARTSKFNQSPASGTNGFNWESAVVNELSRVIADRFEHELLHQAIRIFFRDVIEPGADDGERILNADSFFALFPKSTEYIRELYTSGDSYTGLDMVSLQLLIREDLANLPDMFRRSPELVFHQLNQYPMALDLFGIADDVYTSASRGAPLPDVINRIAARSYASAEMREITGVLAAVSNALRAPDGGESVWLDPAVYLNPAQVATDAFVCQFYQRLEGALAMYPTLTAYINAGPGTPAEKMYELLTLGRDLNDAYEYAAARNFKLLTFADQVAYVRKINGALNRLLSVFFHDSALRVHYHITDRILQMCDTYTHVTEALVQKNYPAAVLTIVRSFGPYLGESDMKNDLLLVAAQLASDNNGDQLRQILRSYIEPIGTSTQKRNDAFHLSINAYAGLQAGQEQVRGVEQANSGFAGVTAPIGIALSFWPHRTGSWTVFLEALDLGSLVNVRLKNDDAEYADLRFEHFLSPGAGVFYNLKHVPVSFGIRYQYLSNLRDITYTDGTVSVTETGRDVSRLSMSVLYDIPLFRLSRKKK